MIDYNAGPIALRMPRGSGFGVKMDDELVNLPIGKSEVVREGKDVVILAYGTCVYAAIGAAALLEENGITPTVVNARFAKPLDSTLLEDLMKREPYLVTVEENARAGGFGSGVLEYLVERGYELKRIKNLGIPDRYMQHASQTELLAEIGLTPENIAQTVLDLAAEQRRWMKSVTEGAK
jgi:1-deoxy-D-xylulose-5-phosphate synthase